MRAQSERNQADRVLAPMAWKVAREIVDSDARFGNFDTIALAHGEDSSGHALAQINAVRSLNGIANSGKLFGQTGVEARGL